MSLTGLTDSFGSRALSAGSAGKIRAVARFPAVAIRARFDTFGCLAMPDIDERTAAFISSARLTHAVLSSERR